MNRKFIVFAVLVMVSVSAYAVLSECSDTSEAASDGSGSCGKNVTYVFDSSTGTLTINGSGDMSSYSYKDAPWYSYRADVKKVIIGSGVTSIGDYAFCGCSSLSSVTIGSGVTSIGNSAFEDCTSLSSVTVAEGNTAYCSSDGVLFSKDMKTLVLYPAGRSDSSYTIPDGVASIGSSAFSGCTSLSSVAIGSGVTSIGSSAFSGCTSLSSVAIGSGVTSIGNSAFRGCSSLSSVAIGSGVTSIGSSAFEDCTGLKELTMPISLNAVASNSRPAFSGCTGIQTVHFTKGTGVGYDYGNSSSSSGSDYYEYTPWFFSKSAFVCAVFDEGITHIGDYAISECANITTIDLPSSLESVGFHSFSGLNKVNELSLPFKLTCVGDHSFAECTNFERISFPSTLKDVGEDAFSGLSFFDYDGSTPLDPDSDSLKSSIFTGTSEKMVKQHTSTVTFALSGTVIGISSYIDGDTSVSEPVLPSVPGYEYSWPEYELNGDNIIVNAIVSLTPYHIAFEANGGSGDMSALTTDIETPVSPECTFTSPDNKHFGGWSLTPAGEIIQLPYTATQDCTLYAIWLWDRYDVTYEVDNVVIFTDTFDYGTQVTVRDIYAKTGYTVTAWSTQDVQVEDGMFVLGASDVAFSASSSVNQYGYTVSYTDASGKVLAEAVSGQADYGTEVEAPIAQVTGYTAPSQVQTITIGADGSANSVTYVYEIITYTITFDDGTVQTQRTYTVENKHVDFPAVTHKKGYAGTWNDFEYNLENITVTANYVIGYYHVSFVSDGTVFSEYDLQYNAAVTKPEAEPTRSATAQYSYSFTGWNGFTEGMLMPDDDISFTAEFSQSVNSYEISFVSEDTVVKSDILEYGAVITLPAQPYKESSVSTDYTFAGWEGYADGMTVTGEAAFVAKYDSSLRSYAITFLNDDGSVISSDTKAYGSRITAPAAAKASTAQYNFTFSRWNDSEGAAVSVPDTVEGEFTAYASYTENLRSYVITYMSDDSEFARFTLYYGDDIVKPDSEPTKASDDSFDYSFSGWQGYAAGSIVTGNATYTAAFAKTVKVVPGDSGAYEVNISDNVASFTAESVSEIAEQAKSDSAVTMSVSLGEGIIAFDNAALQTLGGDASDLVINRLDPDQMTSAERDIVGDNAAYSITFGNNKTFGNGKVTVTLPYQLDSGEDADKLTIYYIADGRVAEEIPCLYNDGYVTFVTDHFSTYAIMYLDPSDGGGSASPILLAVIGIIAAIAAIAAVVIRKKKSA